MGQASGFKYSKTVKFAVYIIMKAKAAAVEPTGKDIWDRETNLLVQCWGIGDESSENKINALAEAISDSVSQFHTG